jgi:hypothetical protein
MAPLHLATSLLSLLNLRAERAKLTRERLGQASPKEITTALLLQGLGAPGCIFVLE